MKLPNRVALLVPILLCSACADRPSGPPPLTADVPLHLEDHLDTAAIAEREVLEVQARRFQAMTEADADELDTILADDLTYTHTTGNTQTKSAFLSALASGLVYESIEPSEVQVRIYGSVAVVTGNSAMRVSAGEQQFALSIRFVEVYRQQADTWQLVAWQSTRMPEP